eukprot:26792_1
MATVTTKSKRKSRKRKYQEMMRETKQIRKITEIANRNQSEHKTRNDTDSDEPNDSDPIESTAEYDEFGVTEPCSQLSQCSQTSQCSVSSQISIPSPSKHGASLGVDNIECDGLLLKSQKANLDELTFLMRGVQCKANENQSDETLHKLKGLIQLGLWLKQDKNQLLLRGSKSIPLILRNLRILSRTYSHEDSIICVIIAILFILTTDNLSHFTDVSINILIRFIRNPQKINDIMYSLRRYHHSPPPIHATSKRRSNRRNRNQKNVHQNTKKNKNKIADDLRQLFCRNTSDDEEELMEMNADTICGLSIGYIASFLLVKIVTFAMNQLQDEYAQQIMDYTCHPGVIYKFASIVQVDCTVLESQGKIHDIHLNQFILLELITRNYVRVSAAAKKVDSLTKQTEKEGLLKILDCIGIGLRFTSRKYQNVLKKGMAANTPMSCDDVDMMEADESDCDTDEDMEVMERLLVLILKVLTNITNSRNVSLKPDTLNSIFYLLSYYDDIVDDIRLLESEEHRKDYQLMCLILGCFINCCERNKRFRISFNEHKIEKMNAIDFLMKLLCKTRKLISQIEMIKEKQEEDEDDAKDKKLYRAYTEYKLISFYVSLLLGFLLQSTENFKYIASKMNELSLILLCLQQFLEFQNQLKRNNSSLNHNHTVTIITKIIQIVQIRNETMKQTNSNDNK